MSRRAALIGLSCMGLVAGLYFVCGLWLAQRDLMERLLSPNPGLELVLPVVFMVLRLGFVCLGPGLVVAMVFALAWPVRKQTRTGIPGGP